MNLYISLLFFIEKKKKKKKLLIDSREAIGDTKKAKILKIKNDKAMMSSTVPVSVMN